MIKRIVINKLWFVIGSAAAFLVSAALQVDLAIPLLLLILYLFLKFIKIDPAFVKQLGINLTFLFLLILATSLVIIRQGWPVYSIPISAIAMLAMILFDDFTVSLLITLAASVTVSSLAGNNYLLFVAFLAGGLASILLVRDIRRRVSLIQAGFFCGFIQALTFFCITDFSLMHPDWYVTLFLNGIISSFIVLATLPLFEIAFKTVTNVSLLELADFNHPLLQRLVQEAPGTYHHSLVVGNLADAACKAIGAHALLARVGAYYHDIGKLSKPGYFTENQGVSGSKHDALTPTMSKLVIMNHVKEGIELAQKSNLNPPIIDFIQQHHGSSLVYYFYRRALEHLEEDQTVKEEGFRYPGPKPKTKETAIVLLADSVEAASRALREPSPSKIEEVVHKIINNKFIDGQLDECDLTLKDLEKIAAVFIHVLGGMYHSRVSYPETPPGADNNTQSSKEDSHQSGKGQNADS